jgi:hypothetical protein
MQQASGDKAYAVKSTEEPQRKAQTAARAAKRQRGRERRKHFKALAREEMTLASPELSKISQKDAMSEVSTDARSQNSSEDTLSEIERLEIDFEARAAHVGSLMKVVVKSTFFDVQIADEQTLLPAAVFETTEEMDALRRENRRWRLAYHQRRIAEEEVAEKPCEVIVWSL